MNRVPVESYLAGVIGGEMGPRRADERQAMLAQAVVSRTFALKNRGRWEPQGFDAWADVRDQVYTGIAGETAEVWGALRATRGEVLRYRGDLIYSYFHSTCGFSTAGADEAFKTAQSQPYLRPISDASGSGHYDCELSPRFRWREEWDGAKLRAILSRTLPAMMNAGGGGLQRITDIAVTRTTASGRVGELRIVFEHGDVRVPGPDVRAVLRPQPDQLLGSTSFALSVTKDGGEVSRLVAAGAGWGHGVGFCQWGAVALRAAAPERRDRSVGGRHDPPGPRHVERRDRGRGLAVRPAPRARRDDVPGDRARRSCPARQWPGHRGHLRTGRAQLDHGG